MNELAEALMVVHASNFALYLKAQNYHWNTEGDDFPMYHAFFGEFYEDVYGANDKLAELIRTLDEYAPGSLSSFAKRSKVADETGNPDNKTKIRNLYTDNQILLSELLNAYRLAERFSKIGISNALQDRIETHEKHAWMLRVMTKGAE